MESGNGQHEKSEASKKKTEERVVNVCTAICNVTDAGDVPVAMGIIPVWLYHKDNPNNKICVYALLDNASGGTFIKEDSLRRLGVKGSVKSRLAALYESSPFICKQPFISSLAFPLVY